MTNFTQAAIDAGTAALRSAITTHDGFVAFEDFPGVISDILTAALPHLGEPVAWQYLAGADGWKQCPPEVVAGYRQCGMIVRPLYSAPLGPANK